MKLNNLIKNLRFDKRMIEWGTRYSIITYEEYQEHLRSLPDLLEKKENMVSDKEVEEENQHFSQNR